MSNLIQNKSIALLAIMSIYYGSFLHENPLISDKFATNIVLEETKIKTEIPKDFDLFCPINKNAKRDENGKFPANTEKWYSEIDGQTQMFRLFKGDSIARGFDAKNFHSRTEAGGTGGNLRFKESEVWHSFEATMKINVPANAQNKKLEDRMTISQLFASCCGPQFRLELTQNGSISYGSRSNGNTIILADKDYSNGINKLKVKLVSNGKYLKVFLNDKQIMFKVDGKEVDMLQTEESKKGTKDTFYVFRWGMYSNKPMDRSITSEVTDITSKEGE
jgi:hypothetical protein